MGKYCLPVLLLLILIPGRALRAQSGDAVDAVAAHLRSGDAAKLAGLFSSAVELHILEEEGTFSKAQAEQVLRDFLSKNRPLAVRVVHRLNSNPNLKMAVLSFTGNREKYRISISLSSSGERFLLKEMRIELDKQ